MVGQLAAPRTRTFNLKLYLDDSLSELLAAFI